MKKFMMSAIACLTVLLLFPMPVMAAGQEEKAESASGIMEQLKQQLEEAIENMDEETVGEVISFVKEKAAEGKLDSAENIQSVIEEGEEKFQVKIEKEEAKKLVATMEKLENMGFSVEYIVEKAEDLYEEYGTDFVDHVDEVVTGAVKNAAGNVANSFFQGLKNSVKSFFQKLFR